MTRAGVAPGTDDEVLRVDDLAVHLPLTSGVLRRPTGWVRAVDGISFTIAAGETLGLVGESGCGKTTTARAILRMVEPTRGRIVFLGQDITHLGRRELRAMRRRMHLLFQDPFASLDPRMRVRAIVAEPLHIHGLYERAGGGRRVAELLELVGLDPSHAVRFPHEFSTGQQQRIALARALALDPKLVVLDEPVSSLDVSIQAQVLNLLKELQARLGLSFLLISHDLGVVRYLCHRVAVMYLGKVAETGTRADIYERPTHPYTQALLSAVPVPDPARRGSRIILKGDVPSAAAPPSGCRFRTRCWKADERCAREEPELVERAGGHPSACFYAKAGKAEARQS